jgi:hypothetical protein
MPVFKTGAINRSANSPTILFYYRVSMVADLCSLSTWVMVMLTFPGTRPAPSLRSVGINEYLAGLARFQASHGLREIFHRDAVCNHRMKIEASAF